MRLMYQFQGQKVNDQGHHDINAHTHRAPYLLNSKAYELQTRYMNGKRRPASATGAMTWAKMAETDHVTLRP